MEALLTPICGGDSRIKVLDLAGTNLSTVDLVLLARAVTKLEGLGLMQTVLVRQQTPGRHKTVEAIFSAVCATDSKLKYLDLGMHQDFGPDEDLVNIVLMARAFKRLEKVVMTDKEPLPLQHWEAIFTEISAPDSKLKVLDLQGSNLSGLDEELLARALNNLEEVNLKHTQFSKLNVEAVLQRSLVKTSLKRMVLGHIGNTLANFELDEELLLRSKLFINEIMIGCTCQGITGCVNDKDENEDEN